MVEKHIMVYIYPMVYFGIHFFSVSLNTTFPIRSFVIVCSIQDPEEARDQFHLARLNCKKFAFVHVALAQFELSQGLWKSVSF